MVLVDGLWISRGGDGWQAGLGKLHQMEEAPVAAGVQFSLVDVCLRPYSGRNAHADDP